MNYTINLTYVCSTCGKCFDTQNPCKGNNKTYGIYCSGRCRKIANLKRGKKQSLEKTHQTFYKTMTNWMNNKIEMKIINGK